MIVVPLVVKSTPNMLPLLVVSLKVYVVSVSTLTQVVLSHLHSPGTKFTEAAVKVSVTEITSPSSGDVGTSAANSTIVIPDPPPNPDTKFDTEILL